MMEYIIIRQTLVGNTNVRLLYSSQLPKGKYKVDITFPHWALGGSILWHPFLSGCMAELNLNGPGEDPWI